jgi:hypothetical protein
MATGGKETVHHDHRFSSIVQFSDVVDDRGTKVETV